MGLGWHRVLQSIVFFYRIGATQSARVSFHVIAAILKIGQSAATAGVIQMNMRGHKCRCSGPKRSRSQIGVESALHSLFRSGNAAGVSTLTDSAR